MSLNVLIVDDSVVTRSVVKRAVSMSGFEVDTFFEAPNGADALAILGKEWVDLVLADLNMPVMNGWELVTRMKDDEVLRGVPVVVISSDRSSRARELTEHGIAGFLSKPFRPESLRETLERVLGTDAKGAPAEAKDDE